ncbi:MAG: TonB-dependent receptor, partial [Candidatus Eisenbacteria bacterium]
GQVLVGEWDATAGLWLVRARPPGPAGSAGLSLAGAVEVDIARGRRADSAPPPCVLDAGVDHTGARSVGLTGGVLRADDAGHWLARAGGGYRGSDGFALAHGLERADPATRARLTSDGERRLGTDIEAWDGFLSLRRVGRGGAWASLTAMGSRLERGVAPEAHTEEPRLWRYPEQARGLGALAAGTGMRDTPWGRGDVEASVGLLASRSEIEEFDGLDYRTVSGGERDDDRTLTARLLGDHTLGEHGDLRLASTFAEVSHDEVHDGDPALRYRQRLWSVAGETDWRMQIGIPLKVTVGGALDGADTPESADKPALAPLSDWGGRLGATTVLRGGGLVIHGASSRRARFPALRELYSGALGRFVENPSLRPETQWMNELGATLRRAGRELQVVVFHQVLVDGITRIVVATPGGNRFQRVNQGRVTGHGLETLGSLELGPLALGGDVTLQRVRGLDAEGKATELEYEPAVQGGAWGETPLPAGFRLRAQARGMGAQRYIDLDSGRLLGLAPTVRFDASLARGFALHAAGPFRRVDAVLALENLADQVLYDQAGLPQPGRTVRLQARFW